VRWKGRFQPSKPLLSASNVPYSSKYPLCSPESAIRSRFCRHSIANSGSRGAARFQSSRPLLLHLKTAIHSAAAAMLRFLAQSRLRPLPGGSCSASGHPSGSLDLLRCSQTTAGSAKSGLRANARLLDGALAAAAPPLLLPSDAVLAACGPAYLCAGLCWQVAAREMATSSQEAAAAGKPAKRCAAVVLCSRAHRQASASCLGCWLAHCALHAHLPVGAAPP
jgi:hypothetical protein